MIDEDSLLKTAELTGRNRRLQTKKVRAYADMEMDYRKFVKKRYLALSKRPKKRLHRMFLKKKDNLVSYIEKIRSSLKKCGKRER